MIIWKNIIKNLILLSFNIFYAISLLSANDDKYDFDVNALIFITNIFLLIFVSGVTFCIIKSQPIFLITEKMNIECVACLDETKTMGVKCRKCENVALCHKCYTEWTRKNSTCPLCRSEYDFV